MPKEKTNTAQSVDATDFDAIRLAGPIMWMPTTSSVSELTTSL